MEDKTDLNCLICTSSAHLSATSNLETNLTKLVPNFQKHSDCSSLKSQTGVIFIISKLLRIPRSIGAELLLKYGNPDQWGLAYCSKCSQEIKQGLDIWIEMQQLEVKIRIVQENLRKELIESYQTDNLVEDSAYHHIRESICCVRPHDSKDTAVQIKSKSQISSVIKRSKRKPVQSKEPVEDIQQKRPRRTLARSTYSSNNLVEKETIADVLDTTEITIKEEVEDFDNVLAITDTSLLEESAGLDDLLAEDTLKQEIEYETTETGEMGMDLFLTTASDHQGLDEYSPSIKSEEDLEEHNNDDEEYQYKKSDEESSNISEHEKSDTESEFEPVKPPKRPRGRPKKKLPDSQEDKPKKIKIKRIRKSRPKTETSDKPKKKRRRPTGPKNRAQCSVCGKSVLHESLYFHMLLHSEDFKFKCRGCDKQFKRKDYWELHEETHSFNRSKFFFCPLCPTKHFSKSKYVSHLRKSHESIMTSAQLENGDVPLVQMFYHCDATGCSDCFMKPEDFIKHLKEHWKDGDQLQCSSCFQSFADLERMKKHEEDVHIAAKTPYACKYCPHALETEEDLEAHLMFHKVEWKLFEDHLCQECGEMFENTKRLKIHIYKSHTVSKFDMDQDGTNPKNNINVENFTKICDKFCRTWQGLEQHCLSNNHTSFHCLHCDKQYKTKCSLKQHAFIHTDITFPCKFENCKKTFPTQSQFNQHIHVVHKGNKFVGSLVCSYCDKIFAAAAAKNRHLAQVHRDIVDPGNKLFFCVCCYRSFDSDASMKTHMDNAHLKLQCKFCKRFCFDTAKLKDHLRSHTGEKPYKCRFCTKGFTMEINKVEHERLLHTFDRPFGCNSSGCQKWFSTMRLCKNHAQKEHPGLEINAKTVLRRDTQVTDESSSGTKTNVLQHQVPSVNSQMDNNNIQQVEEVCLDNNESPFINQSVWNSSM